MTITIGSPVGKMYNAPFTPLLNWTHTLGPHAGDIGKVIRIFPIQSGPDLGEACAEVEFAAHNKYSRDPTLFRVAILVRNLVRVEL